MPHALILRAVILFSVITGFQDRFVNQNWITRRVESDRSFAIFPDRGFRLEKEEKGGNLVVWWKLVANRRTLLREEMLVSWMVVIDAGIYESYRSSDRSSQYVDSRYFITIRLTLRERVVCSARFKDLTLYRVAINRVLSKSVVKRLTLNRCFAPTMNVITSR